MSRCSCYRMDRKPSTAGAGKTRHSVTPGWGYAVVHAFLHSSDTALYLAKKNGRNCIEQFSIALAAQDAGRSVAIVGRSLRNMDAAARECGYLKTLPPFLSEDDIEDVPDDNLLMLITGSQGEARSALSRISRDDFTSTPNCNQPPPRDRLPMC